MAKAKPRKSAGRPSRARRSASAKRSGPVVDDVVRRIQALASNLQWSWNHQTKRLFAALDPALWEATNHDPLRTFALLGSERASYLAQDQAFVTLLRDCERGLSTYLRTKPWFAGTFRGSERRLLVAYFCSEYAIHESMQQYSGGLGVLAGDHLKSASDLGVPLVGVGRLYRCGYFRQAFAADGSQRASYPHYDFSQMPIEDTGVIVDVPIGNRVVHARVWKLLVGRTRLFLLDADFDANRPQDRGLTRYLYGGGPEYRIRQQVLLGVGGHRALEALGVRPTVYHLNEGHAAFCGLDRVRRMLERGRSFDKAVAATRATSVFTTHTPVPAGHDRYDPKLVTTVLKPLADELGLTRESLLAFGRENPSDRSEPFCMTVLALKLSSHANAVAKLHGETTRRMWQGFYGARTPRRVPIGHVTNGIHAQTWLAEEIEPLYRKYLRPRWLGMKPSDDPWKRAGRIPPGALWTVRCVLRAKLVRFVRQRLEEQIRAGVGPVEVLSAAHTTFDENALTIGFARRFATYKRAPLIFKDARRLAAILNDPQRPVQLVFAGKAHPQDASGQAFAKRIYRHAQTAGFRGRVALLEDYDMHVGRMLTGGCDVWLNNPLRPNEASGTSGMKPPLHGGLNCSILDGWWPEAYNRRNGWAIGSERPLESRAAQDKHDAEQIYELLETQIVPLFYDRDAHGVPRRWVKMMINSIKSVGGVFNTHRMVGEYVEKYYLPAHRMR